jgi:hypothetical protein
VYIEVFKVYVKWVPFHQSVTRNQVADGGDGLYVWSLPASAV